MRVGLVRRTATRGLYFDDANVAFEHATPDDAAVDVALRIDADAFSAGMVRDGGFHVLDERGDGAVLGAADADALLDAGQFVRAGIGTRLGVSHVDRVVAGDRDATRPAELTPLGEERPSWSKIWMRLFSRSPTKRRPRESIAIVCGSLISPGPDPFLPHSLTNLPSLRELHDAIVLAVAVTVRDEDVAVRRRRGHPSADRRGPDRSR